MKVTGIEFHGFKSFADSAEIRFHDGITTIVGPNGCGKSNISDALRWVLGEQRPTVIRGSRMEEVIFQGTQRRKPIHRAEVVLKISNEDQLLPVPYSDVRISRTVYRGGESDYRLNGALCRLRDIQDLCRDTGIGSNAYAIIEGRMIDAILSDRAEERRAMFEEAAGIGRYKERRRVASHRLDEADADLARVDDLISEVQTKVRSLARQRGRAQRYLEMRERKLALELALALAEATRLEERQKEIESELRRLDEARTSDAAEQRSSEAEYEAVRAEQTDSERGRAENAGKLMAVRDQLADRDRARLLAEERARHATARLERLAVERGELRERKRRLAEQVERLIETSRERSSALHTIRETLARQEIALAEVAERRGAMEAGAAVAESEQQAYREQRAKIQARRDSAKAEATELGRLVQQAEQRLATISAATEEAAGDAQQARKEAATAEKRLRQVANDLAAEREKLAQIQTERDEARLAQAAVVERLRATEARIEALVSITSGDEGLSPAVQAVLAKAKEFGVRGILGREIAVAEDVAEGVESYLGAYLEGVVVTDGAAVARIRRWFLEEYEGPGGLVILPLDRVPDQEAPDGRLPPGIQTKGPCSAWLGYLLRDVRIVTDLAGTDGNGAWIGPKESVDALGVCRLGRPHVGAGILVRRAELDRLQSRRDELESDAAALAEEFGRAEQRLSSRASKVDELESARRAAEENRARLAARAEATTERLARVREEDEMMRATVAQLNGERERALASAEAEAAAFQALEPDGPAEVPATDELAAVREEYEQLRERVTDLRLDEARGAAALDRVDQDLQAQKDAVRSVEHLSVRLDQEAEELEASLAKAEEESRTAAADLETLFEEKAKWEHEALEVEESAESLRQKVSELDDLLRHVRSREREHSERHHALDLERSQVVAALNRTRERLEDEWGRPFDEMVQEVEAASGQPSELEAELEETAERLNRMGPVNMLAEQEYREERERLDFLQGQRADLVKARDDLRETIKRVNDTASRTLIETIEQIRISFRRTFSTLFEGGECDVWLEQPERPLDSAIEISASPAGKRTRRIHMLSGGERALTALALLFALYLVKPSPFCVMDEVDAPLDETNIRRFVAMLERFKSDVQFIVITHNPVTIEAADWIYGVTMEDPGVSKIVGVEFADFARGAVA